MDKLASIAHEFAHCYQSYYNPDAMADDTYRGWWVEGGAEWLSSLVYPAGFPNGLSAKFRYDSDTLRETYSNVYFWLFAATAQGAGSNEDALNFMVGVPQDAQAHADYLDGINPDQDGSETFHQWMLSLVNNRIPYNPPVNAPGFTQKSALSGTVNLSTLRFSGDRVKILDIQVDTDNRATVTASALGDSNYAVSGKIGGTWVRLEEDEVVEFCPEAGVLELLVSRALSGQDDRTEFTLTFDQTPSPMACDKVPAESACYMGDWRVVGLPAGLPAMDTSGYIYAIESDGTFTGTYSLISETSTMNYPMTGTYQIEANETSPRQFTAYQFSTRYGAGSATADIGGEMTDISVETLDMLNSLGDLPVPFAITCDGTQMTWTIGEGFTFTLARITP